MNFSEEQYYPPYISSITKLKDKQTRSRQQFYNISVFKLAMLLFVTFGLFSIYWWYKNWRALKDSKYLNVNPFLRAIFPIFYFNELLGYLKNAYSKNGININQFKFLTILYMVIYITSFSLYLYQNVAVFYFQSLNYFPAIISYVYFNGITYLPILFTQNFINKLNNANVDKQVRKLSSLTIVTNAVLVLLCLMLLLSNWYTDSFKHHGELNRATNLYMVSLYPQFSFDADKAFQIALPIAQAGDPRAQALIGDIILIRGHKLAPVSFAVQNYQSAAAQNNAIAQFNLGLIYDYGLDGIPQNYNWAANYYLQSAKNGNIFAYTNLGRLYDQGLGEVKDSSKALYYYQMAANKDPRAMYYIGHHYLIAAIANNSYMYSPDLPLIKLWYSKAYEMYKKKSVYKLFYFTTLLSRLGDTVPACTFNDMGILYASYKGPNSNLYLSIAVNNFYYAGTLYNDDITSLYVISLRDALPDSFYRNFAEFQYHKYQNTQPSNDVEINLIPDFTYMSNKLEKLCSQ